VVPRHVVSLYRDRLDKEQGWIKKDWGGRLRVALVYPHVYRVGMSNLGFQWVYHLFNSKDHVVAERAFLPDGHELSLYRQAGSPLLSLESQRPLADFHLIAFSLSFENDYPNILNILELAGLPVLSSQRADLFPLVAAGGMLTFLNPEPISSFFDFFVVGEAEPQLDALIDILYEGIENAVSKVELLEGLAKKIPSVYVPEFYKVAYSETGVIKEFESLRPGIAEKIKVAKCAEQDLVIAWSPMKSPETEFSDMQLLELGRGCGRGCRFCAAGFVYRPPRFHKEERLRDFIHQRAGAGIRWGLVSSALSDFPNFKEIANFILEQGSSFSVSSLRADVVSIELLERIKQAGQKTVTLAPEAGSERLRRVINKNLSREEILEAARCIAEVGDLHLRLYFLIGLPTETQEDIEAILDLVKAIKHNLVKIGAPRGKVSRIRLSINCFVPKPFTPFQWVALEQLETLKQRQKWLKRMISKEGGIQINFDVPKWAYVQTLSSMGDRRVGRILALVHEYGGDWKKALRHTDLNPDFFVYRSRSLDEMLPWDFLDHGINKKYLMREYEKALAQEFSPPCQPDKCTACGACPLH